MLGKSNLPAGMDLGPDFLTDIQAVGHGFVSDGHLAQLRFDAPQHADGGLAVLGGKLEVRERSLTTLRRPSAEDEPGQYLNTVTATGTRV